jgi:hypothetical protein
MGYREDEKKRYARIKPGIFRVEACRPGSYKKKPREFCLGDGCEAENLLPQVREDALAYFADRKIRWHDGARGRPSNHLCCSQSAAVNAWFIFGAAPTALAAALRSLGWPVAEVLPFTLDGGRYVAFEWIGTRNYMGETRLGRVVKDGARSRGKGFTSADFAMRFRREDGRIEIVLGEWKYTERYPKGADMRFSDSGTDRAAIYGPHVHGSQLRLGHLPVTALMFDPFDQLLRLQLLASAMEREREMEADIVSVLYLAPRANLDFTRRITAPALSGRGDTVHVVWASLVEPERFRGIDIEALVPILRMHAPDPTWASGMHARYGW